MTDLGDLSLSWRADAGGKLFVTCRELPEFSVIVPPDDDPIERMQTALELHLAPRYGIEAALAPETDTIRFRCRSAA